MTDIKLARLPERTPVRLSVSLSPDQGQALNRYAEFYQSTYGVEEAVSDLVPAIVATFLESDKAFARWCRDAAERSS